MTVIKQEDLKGSNTNDTPQEKTKHISVFNSFEGKNEDALLQNMDIYFGDVLPKETSDADEVDNDENFNEGDNSSAENSDDERKSQQNSQQSENDENSEESEETEESDEETASDKDDSRKDKKSSRSTKRIKQLLEEKKKAYSETEKERELRLEAERERDILRKKLAETNVKSIDQQIQSLKSQMVNAQDEGNTELYVDLSTQLSELQGNKKAFEAVQAQYKDLDENKKSEPQKQQQHQSRPSEIRSELLTEWIESTPWFVTQQRIYEDDGFRPTETHVKATQMAVQMENTLIQEGYDPETEEFYEILTKRMNKLIKMYGVDNTLLGTVQSELNTKSTGVSSDSVSENNINKTEGDGEDTKVTSKARPKVSGSTRTTGSPTKSTQRIETIDPLTRKIAEGLGYDPVEYAKGNFVPLKD